ncbi:NUDIX domain-containing protein [Deinococcus aquiradiocola]|uniref:DNA mismatch repair protein MutT n=1 Tax=Deinococcus aquiradiocola TaxID=393059 RepID=A0A917PJ52_9DEIO|nr:NUDIX domain-containing protein [Deinococcus aquiradiocola]GGJ80062.1 DNA mismatch repair protein MutT [Deinococcus aquiradiocola]
MGDLRTLLGPRPLFSVGVSAVLQDDAGGWLLQRRSDNGLWGVPGGGVEPGETFEEAAARELHEETGLTGVTLAPWGTLSGPEMHHVYPNGDEVFLVGRAFRGTLSAAQLSRATLGSDGETLELRVFALDDLPALSGAVERWAARQLRAERGLPARPDLQPVPRAVQAGGNHLAELRAVLGPRPLFAPGANVIVQDDAGRVLLLRHAGTGRWTLPGGSLELGESLVQGAQRELLEETGLRAAQLEELEFYAGAAYRFTYPHGDVIDNVAVLYRAHGVTGTLTPQVSEVLEAAWFAPPDLPGPDDLSGPLIRAMLQRLHS